jgi:hypothetical protein
VTISKFEKKALETVESALDGRIGVAEAAHALLPFLRMQPDFTLREDFDLIRAVASETDHLPIGRVRELWHTDSLREKDRELVRYDALWHEQMVSACQRIRRMLLLRKLVVNRHLNVAERQSIRPVRRKEVVAILRSLMSATSVFPAEGCEGIAFEGASIGLMSSGAQLILSRNDPIQPQTIAERRVERYDNVEAAIEAFIDHEWRDGIDGIALEPTT